MKTKININKKIFSVLSLTFLLMIMSCEKDVVDLQPVDRITETLAYSTPERVELSMVGVYDAIQSGFYLSGAVRGYPFGAANTEQGDMRGEDMLNVAAFYAVTYEATYSTTSANNIYMWFTLYNAINKANIVIDGVKGALESGVLSEADAKAYEGEARFIRALCHHELLIHFARPYKHTGDASHYGVPYRSVAINNSEALESEKQKGRNSVAECYNLLLDDLQYAEANLPASRAGTKNVTRATKGAATALKSRVLLHKGDWPGVISTWNDLKEYTLESSPAAVFTNNGANSESIFSVESSDLDNAGVNGALANMYGVSPGRQLIAISPIMFNNPNWLADDARRSLLVKEGNNGFFINKYTKLGVFDDYNPVLRYAEVVLNTAEAYARIGNNTENALNLLNSVRNRAVTNSASQFTAADFANDKDLLGAILFERRIEFLGEGRRWPDIHRLALDPDFSTGGIPAKVAFGNTVKGASNADDIDWVIGRHYENGVFTGKLGIQARDYDDFRFVWPIPQDETNTNEVLRGQQNPGY